MNRIESFKVDHNKLDKGIYISRTDGDIVTYDLRTRKPNSGDYMDNITMHTIEHMFATYVRNSEISDNVIYFGPMGCQTGFYLLVAKETPEKVLEVTKEVLEQIINHQGDVFGASAVECGNYKSLDLSTAKEECSKYLAVLNSKDWDFKYE